MSRKTILLLAGLYFLAAVAFSVFHVVTNPFLSDLNSIAIGKAVGGRSAIVWRGRAFAGVGLGALSFQTSVCSVADAVVGFLRNSTRVFF